jgi:hypothetical protein
VVECLPSKCQTLNSNPSPTQYRKKEGKRETKGSSVCVCGYITTYEREKEKDYTLEITKGKMKRREEGDKEQDGEVGKGTQSYHVSIFTICFLGSFSSKISIGLLKHSLTAAFKNQQVHHFADAKHKAWCPGKFRILQLQNLYVKIGI